MCKFNVLVKKAATKYLIYVADCGLTFDLLWVAIVLEISVMNPKEFHHFLSLLQRCAPAVEFLPWLSWQSLVKDTSSTQSCLTILALGIFTLQFVYLKNWVSGSTLKLGLSPWLCTDVTRSLSQWYHKSKCSKTATYSNVIKSRTNQGCVHISSFT